jgi:phospholipid/cholesterol/gamma-HCH transport system substrate-binding protein
VGLNIGIIDDLVFINDSLIRVDMNIDQAYTGFMKKDAKASISTNGLVGDMIINIMPGNGGGRIIEDGDIIESISGIGTEDVLGILNNTADDLGVLISNLNSITENMLNGKGSMATLLNDPEMSHDLKDVFRNLSNASININSLTEDIEKSMNQIHNGDGLLGYLLYDTSLTDKVDLIIDNIDKIVIEKMEPLVANIEASSQHVLNTSKDLEDLIDQIDLNEGAIGLLLRDTASTHSIQEIINNLNEGTFRFNESMEALKHNFLLRGYFKKQEKKRLQELKEAN